MLLAIVVMTSSGVAWGANRETSPTAESSSPESNTSDVENTERNVRDKSGATLTPENQVEDDGDRKITAEIRRAVVGADSLSLNAHNVKIITRNRVVTLRGPVESKAEKTTIGNLARQAAGVQEVQNQLEIERQAD